VGVDVYSADVRGFEFGDGIVSFVRTQVRLSLSTLLSNFVFHTNRQHVSCSSPSSCFDTPKQDVDVQQIDSVGEKSSLVVTSQRLFNLFILSFLGRSRRRCNSSLAQAKKQATVGASQVPIVWTFGNTSHISIMLEWQSRSRQCLVSLMPSRDTPPAPSAYQAPSASSIKR